MFLTYRKEAMNYEALGRYTEAKEEAEKAAIEVHNAIAVVSRLADSRSGTSSLGQAREIDFVKLREAVDKAEAAYGRMTGFIHVANHAAPDCDKPLLKLVKF